MIDCYDKILNLYHEKIEHNFMDIDDETWILNANYLRSFVNKLDKEIENYEKVKNCVLLLINLCFGIEDTDHYVNKGKSYKELSQLEKENYTTLLKAETN